ncbi:MAG: omptin family outer membrane protease [Deltaproteobacteria bacterium]|nr:omptin family outer membrane protease [Deltaproteobacteria bacterium]
MSLLLFAGVLRGSAYAEFRKELGFETRYMAGSSLYEINFDNAWVDGGHGRSELIFPVQTFMGGLVFELKDVPIDERDSSLGALKIKLLSALASRVTTMEDSDWIENDMAFLYPMHDGKDLYTESNDNLDKAFYFDIEYSYDFFVTDALRVAPVLGYNYLFLSHDIVDCEGYYWSMPIRCGSIDVLSYEVEAHLPYLGLKVSGAPFHSNRSEYNLTVAYSPKAFIKDQDYHILRDKYSYSQNFGDAVRVVLEGGWKPREDSRFGVKFGGEFMSFFADGVQAQYIKTDVIVIYLDSPINFEIQGAFLSLYLNISYIF